MAEYKVISTQALIEKFRYALDNHWGYIWGAAGVLWTQAKQNQKVQYMVGKYGTKWKNNSSAKGNNYYSAAVYGSKWIGHYVADCSGLFSWAFSQLGGKMYHGSNTMWDSWCQEKGELTAGKRGDGQELKPGTAVFTYNKSTKKRGHVGLYIGDGYVIEASGTQAGVVKSKITLAKWVEWGELKGVDYGAAPQPVPPDPKPEKGYAVVTGVRVALRKAPTTQASVILRVDTGKQVKLEEPPPSEWEYVSYNGHTGYMMKKFLKEGG